MTQIVPRHDSSVTPVGFRLMLERLPGDRVQTGLIDVGGVEFKAWARTNRIDYAIAALARELANHLNISRDDVDINEDDGVRGMRRFRLIAHYLGKPKAATDGVAAWQAYHNYTPRPVPQIPDYIDI